MVCRASLQLNRHVRVQDEKQALQECVMGALKEAQAEADRAAAAKQAAREAELANGNGGGETPPCCLLLNRHGLLCTHTC